VSTLRTARRRQASLAVVATFMLGLLSAVPVAAADDIAPTVTGTTPADGATAVALNAVLSVTFSEPVDVTGNWFRVVCDQSSNHLSAAGGGPVTWSIDPINDFIDGENCWLTLVAENITDQDADDPPDTMDANVVVAFTVAAAAPTPDPAPQSTGATFIKKPVKALPAVNKAKAGRTVPIRFWVGKDQDVHSFTAASEAYTCGATPPTTASDQVVTRNIKAQRHDRHRHDRTYTFTWHTKKAWKGTCRVFVLTLDDGSSQAVAFRFK
jgi:hypothetical protein